MNDKMLLSCENDSHLRNISSTLKVDMKLVPQSTKGVSITALLTSCLTGLESAVCQLTIFVFICK
jgi:hypothetical protein